jgi:hypothetical protein
LLLFYRINYGFQDCFELIVGLGEESSNRAGRRKIGPMKLLILVFIALAGCSSWHWEKRGALDGDYARDENFCKQQVYSTADGVVTNATVRRMHACMMARGWQKVAN